MRQARHAYSEVVRNAFDERADVDGVSPGLAADTLEAMRHSIEAEEIGAHAGYGGLGVVRVALLEQLHPTDQARQRCSELVRRLARHARPDTFPLRVAARTYDVHGGEQQHESTCGLERGNYSQPANNWRIAEVDLTHQRIDDRRIVGIEHARVRAQACRVAAPVGRNVGRVRWLATQIGDDERHALFANAPGEIQHGLRTGALTRVALRPEHAGIALAGAARFCLKVADDTVRVDDVRRKERDEQGTDHQLANAQMHGLREPVG